MSNQRDWYVYLFKARNKDNAGIQGFRERQKGIVASGDREESVRNQFQTFVEQGQDGELCRLYKSVNKRDFDKVLRAFISRTLYTDSISSRRINSMLVSEASKKCNAKESKWLIDFDSNDEELFCKFLADLEGYTTVECYRKTINGYAVIITHGFDVREILEKYDKDIVDFKRDDLLLMGYKRKQET